MYYAFIENNLINGCGQCPCVSENIISLEITEEQFNLIEQKGNNYYVYQEGKLVLNPDYDEIVKRKERERLDALTLTPSDVERALYKAKGMDFEDLKALISRAIPTIDLKGLAIEFRAKDFWRGATLEDGTRIFDVVGALLSYTPEDMDYLFENKELPILEKAEEPIEPDTDEDNIEEAEEL